MPNINAALGLSQLENILEKLKSKEVLMKSYCEIFENNEIFEVFEDKNEQRVSNNWLITLMLKLKDKSEILELRNNILKKSHENGIFIRPAWNILSELPMYKSMPRSSLKIVQDIYPRLINLPSSPYLARNLEFN